MERAGGLMTDGFGHNRVMPRRVVTNGVGGCRNPGADLASSVLIKVRHALCANFSVRVQWSTSSWSLIVAVAYAGLPDSHIPDRYKYMMLIANASLRMSACGLADIFFLSVVA